MHVMFCMLCLKFGRNMYKNQGNCNKQTIEWFDIDTELSMWRVCTPFYQKVGKESLKIECVLTCFPLASKQRHSRLSSMFISLRTLIYLITSWMLFVNGCVYVKCLEWSFLAVGNEKNFSHRMQIQFQSLYWTWL